MDRLVAKHWKGVLIPASFDNDEVRAKWKEIIFNNQLTNTQLVVFEMPANRPELIGSIEAFLQKEVKP